MSVNHGGLGIDLEVFECLRVSLVVSSSTTLATI
jgi:hypothetical protein